MEPHGNGATRKHERADTNAPKRASPERAHENGASRWRLAPCLVIGTGTDADLPHHLESDDESQPSAVTVPVARLTVAPLLGPAAALLRRTHLLGLAGRMALPAFLALLSR